MAIVAVKQQYSVYNGASTNPITFQYVVGNTSSGTGRYLVVFHGGDTATATFDGVAMSAAATDTSPFCRAWVVEDAFLPTDTSPRDVVFTFGGNRTNQGVLFAEFSGVEQLGVVPVAACNSAASGDTHTVALTTTVDGVPVVLFYLRVEDRTMDAQPSGTVLHTTDAGVVFDAQRIILATGVTPAGAQTFTFDPSGASNGRVGAVQLIEQAVAGDVTGDAAWSIPAPSFAASGEIPIAAASQFVVPSIGFGGAAQVPVAAQAALAIPAVSLSASGDVPVSGDTALGVPAVQFSGAAQGDVAGTAGITLPGIAFAAGGDITVRGALSLAMPALTMSMAGTVADFRALIITGRMVMRAAITGETTLRQAVTGAASMRQHITGRTALHPFAMVPGDPPLPGGAAVFGTLVATIPPLAFAGVGELVSPPLEGQAALTIPSIGFGATAGLALPPIEATAALSLPMLTLAGSGTVADPVVPLLHTFSGGDNASTVGTADSGHAPIAFSGTWGRIGGEAYMSAGVAHAVLGFDCGTGDGRIEATIRTNADNLGRINGRISDNINYIQLTNNAIGDLRKRVNNVVMVLGSGFGNASAGQDYGLDFSGSSISVVRNGVVLTTVTDSFNQAATIHGLGNASSTGTGNRWDDLTFTPA